MPVKSVSETLRIRRSRTGLGLFAEKIFRRGEFITEYTGERITNAEADRRWSKYLFETSSRYTIDGAARGNVARYINHSCEPNARAEIDRGRVFIYAKRRIDAGEEITYNYGKSYFESIIAPIGCRCIPCDTARASKRRKAANVNKRTRAPEQAPQRKRA